MNQKERAEAYFCLDFFGSFFHQGKMNKEKKVSTRACPQTACTEPEGKKKVKEKKEKRL